MTREEEMVRQWGEVVSQTKAGRILSRHPNTVKAMLADGRLALACGGEMVDVRSIAAYIQQPKQIDELARQRKMGRKWSV